MNMLRYVVLLLGLNAVGVCTMNADALSTLLGQVKAAASAKKPLPINQVAAQFFNQMKLPAPIANSIKPAGQLSNVQIMEQSKIPSVSGLRGIEKITYTGEAGFSGSMQFGNNTVTAQFNVYHDASNSRFFSVALRFKSGIKPSAILPAFKPLDIFSLPEIQLVFTTFPHFMGNDSTYVFEGANIVGRVDLSGPFALMGKIKDSSVNAPGVVINMAGPVSLVGALGTDLSAKYKIIVPLRIGMDLTKIKDIPKGFSKEIQKITTDDFIAIVSINLKRGSVAITLQSGMQVTLRALPKPLALQGFGTVNVTSTDFSIGGKLPNMIELNFVSIGDLGIELYSEAGAREALLGFPFTGIGLRGRINIGKPSDSRASLAAAGKLSSRGLIFDIIGTHLNFTDLIQLLSQAATRAKVAKPLPKGSVPTIVLNRVRGKFSPFGGSVAGRQVSTGMALEMDMTLFDKNFGVVADVDFDRMRFESKGWMPKTSLTLGNKLIMSLGGAGKDKRKGTADDGPYVHSVFDMKNPTAAAFVLSSDIEIPALKLAGMADLSYAFGKYVGTLESSAFGFGAAFKFNIDPIKWRDMYIAFDFKNDFNQFLSQQAKPALEALKKKSTQELADLDTKIKDLTDKISGATEKVANPEIAKTKKTIATIKKKIAALQKKCSNASWIEKAVVCTGTTAEIAVQGAALKAQELYLKGLAATKTIVKLAANVVNDLKKDLAVVQNARKAVAATATTVNNAIDALTKNKNLITVKRVTGGVSAVDISQGKVPLIKELDAVVNIPGKKAVRVKLKNIGFDFTDSQKSSASIASSLLKAAKII